MENRKIVSLAIMSVVMGTTIATASANGIRGRFGDPTVFSETMRAEREALLSGDYQRWRSAVENSGQTEILAAINESNFARFSRAFALCEKGDMEGAETIIDELEGAELPKCGMRKMAVFSPEDRKHLEIALTGGDYGSWKEIMERTESGWGEYLTEENFTVLVRAYKLWESGDRTQATEVLDRGEVPHFLFIADRAAGHGRGMMDRAREDGRDAALTAAFESGDYGAWKALMEERGGGKILEIVDANNFSEFARAKLFQREGKMAEAKEILDDLGFPFPGRKPRSGASVQQG